MIRLSSIYSFHRASDKALSIGRPPIALWHIEHGNVFEERVKGCGVGRIDHGEDRGRRVATFPTSSRRRLRDLHALVCPPIIPAKVASHSLVYVGATVDNRFTQLARFRFFLRFPYFFLLLLLFFYHFPSAPREQEKRNRTCRKSYTRRRRVATLGFSRFVERSRSIVVVSLAYQRSRTGRCRWQVRVHGTEDVENWSFTKLCIRVAGNNMSSAARTAVPRVITKTTPRGET